MRKPNNAKLNFRNVLYNTKESKIILGTDQQQNPARKYASMSIDEDIDDWAFNKRATNLGLPSIPSTDQIGVVSGKPQITYPDACKRKSITHGLNSLGGSKHVLSVKRKSMGSPPSNNQKVNQSIKKHKMHIGSNSQQKQQFYN